MTVAIILAISAAFLYAITNHIDKYLVCKMGGETTNLRSLLIFSTLVAGAIISPIWLVLCHFQVAIPILSLLMIIIAAIFFVLGTYFYFKALEKNDASMVVVMFQLIPVFSFILGLIFLRETLSLHETIGALLIIGSAVIISLEFDKRSEKRKLLALILMTISSLAFALYFFLFEVSVNLGTYTTTAFWYQVALLAIGLILISRKSFRHAFIRVIKKNGKKFVGLNIINEALTLTGGLMINFANTMIMIALVTTLNGFEGAFSFIIGAVGVLLFPKVIEEDLRKKIVLQKTVSIIIGIIGLIVLVLL